MNISYNYTYNASTFSITGIAMYIDRPDLTIVIDLSRNTITQSGMTRELSSADSIIFNESISLFPLTEIKPALFANKYFTETYMSEQPEFPPEHIYLWWFNPNTFTMYESSGSYSYGDGEGNYTKIVSINLRDNIIYTKTKSLSTSKITNDTTTITSADYYTFMDMMKNIDATDELVSALLSNDYYVNSYLPSTAGWGYTQVDTEIWKYLWKDARLKSDILIWCSLVLPFENLYAERFMKPQYADRITAKYDETHSKFIRLSKEVFRSFFILPGVITVYNRDLFVLFLENI